MRRWAIYMGWFLIIVGVISLVSAIWQIDLGKYIWPAILVALGIWVLVKPANTAWWDWFGVFSRSNDSFSTILTGTGSNKEQSIFAGETVVNLSADEIPEGGLNLKFNGFAGEIRLYAPVDVGVRVRANYFAGEIAIYGEKITGVMAPIDAETPGFDLAPRKVYVEVNYFAGETMVIQRA